MSIIIISCFLLYTALLFCIMWLTSRKAGNNTYFRANRKSPWPVVAYGMIGASLSGVTFMSVPGYVQTTQFTYFGVVIGNMIGYIFIALILLPLYYKLDLTSIYTYLNKRFGFWSNRSGSFFFIISRLVGSALRMYLVVYVLYEFVFRYWGIPFWVPALLFTAIVLLYTLKGGMRTIIWTDTLQTTFMLLATGLTIYMIFRQTQISIPDFFRNMSDAGYTKFIETDWRADNFFLKQIVSGAFLTLAMNGLDQEMMQKSLSCKNLRDAQKNIFTLSISLVLVNLFFLTLGGVLLYYASYTGFILPTNSDGIFPAIAFDLSTITMVFFIIGLLAAGYSSADGTLTSLTTTICFDFLNFGGNERPVTKEGKKFPRTYLIISGILFTGLALCIVTGLLHHSGLHTICCVLLFAALLLYLFYGLTAITGMTIPEEKKVNVRKKIHLLCGTLYFLIIVAFNPFHNDSLIKTIFTIASFTYGPLLGLFCFGLFTKWEIKEKYVPFVSILSPVICYILKIYSEEWFNGYQFGFELLILNGLLTFIGLCVLVTSNS